MHVSGLAFNDARYFSLCSVFFDEWFSRSNQVQKRLAWVGYAYRNRPWLLRAGSSAALIAHLNSVHLSLPGVRLPGEFAQTVNVCPRCRLIVNSRGCPSCQGKSGRASDEPRVQMDVDAAQQVLNVCRGRATAWKEQAWNTLWSLSLKKKLKAERRTRAGQKNEKLRQRIRRVMADKGSSKAARELVSDGIHEVDEEILERLRSLHPHEDPYIAEAGQEAACSWPGLTEDDDDFCFASGRNFGSNPSCADQRGSPQRSNYLRL